MRSLIVSVVSCVALALLLETSAHPLAQSGVASSSDSAGKTVSIKHVNPLQIERDLSEYDTAIVFYYVDYCPVCSMLRPVFAKASHLLGQQQLEEALNGEIAPRRVFAAVNCGTNAQGCIRTGVTRVPVFKRFRNGGRDGEVLRYRRVNAAILLEAVNAE